MTRRFSRFIIDENFNSTTLDHDIALLELETAVNYSLNVRPVCLEPMSVIDREFFQYRRYDGKVVGCGRYSAIRKDGAEVLQASHRIICQCRTC